MAHQASELRRTWNLIMFTDIVLYHHCRDSYWLPSNLITYIKICIPYCKEDSPVEFISLFHKRLVLEFPFKYIKYIYNAC